jgi:hypothetical protein
MPVEEVDQQFPFSIAGLYAEDMIFLVEEMGLGRPPGFGHARDQTPRHGIAPHVIPGALSYEHRAGERCRT